MSGNATPMACVLTSTSPDLGTGVGISTSFRTSGPPVSNIWMAFMGHSFCVALSTSGLEQDLSHRLSRLEQSVGVRGLRQRQSHFDCGRQLAGRKEFDNRSTGLVQDGGRLSENVSRDHADRRAPIDV